MDINSVTAPIVRFYIISHAGTFWTGDGWSRDDDDAISFATRESAEIELRDATANNPRSYIVTRDL